MAWGQTVSFDLAGYKVSPFTLVLLVDGDKVLTLRRSADKQIYPDKLSGFGGKVEPGEDLFVSARREFQEETGLTVHDLTLRGMLTRILDTGYINEMYIFIAIGFSGELREQCDEGQAQWLPVEGLLKHPDVVDHLPLYLAQVVAGNDFYCGIANYEQGNMVSYSDNRAHFADRKARA